MPQRAHPAPRRRRPATQQSAFTLVELLVVMGIIVILIGILIPTVGRIKRKAQDAANRSWMAQLAQAIDAYNTDFRAYPGPLSNDEVCNTVAPVDIAIDPAVPAAEFDTGVASELKERLTMSENLVLGLLGGLRLNTVSPTPRLYYDPRSVGSGAAALSARAAKRSPAYLEAKNLSWRTEGGKKTGQFKDESGSAKDTIIPEFVDTYPDAMPILYLRAKRGSRQANTPYSERNNSIVTYHAAESDPLSPDWRFGHYDLHQVIGYTGESIGIGRTVTPVNITGTPPIPPHGLRTVDVNAIFSGTSANANYHYPYDAYPYLRNQPASTPADGTTDYANLSFQRTDVPRQKDGYILISAGLDRVYGTNDDVTNFGSVSE